MEAKRKTSISLDATALDAARELGVNVSAVANDALQLAITNARQRLWFEENSQAFVAQSEWHERHGHPLSEIIVGPAGATWED